jgi:hypothetical protein
LHDEGEHPVDLGVGVSAEVDQLLFEFTQRRVDAEPELVQERG